MGSLPTSTAKLMEAPLANVPAAAGVLTPCRERAALLALSGLSGDVASADAATAVAPLVECARRKVLAIQAHLDTLALNEELSIEQLGANRDSALAALQGAVVAGVDAEAVLAVFRSGIDAVLAAATAKRTGLETELVAADAALVEALDATTALAEVQ